MTQQQPSMTEAVGMVWEAFHAKNDRDHEQLIRERDEARAARDRLRVDRDYWQAETAHRASQTDEAWDQRNQLLDGDMELWTFLVGNRNTPAARATLERLRAAQCMCGPASVISEGPNVDCPAHGLPADQAQLPDVGPVERDERGQWVCGCSLASVGTSSATLRSAAQEAMTSAAELLAVAAKIDAEAAAPDNDDEVSIEPAAVIRDHLMTTAVFGLYTDEEGVQRLAEGIADALDAHRARSAEGGVTAWNSRGCDCGPEDRCRTCSTEGGVTA